MSQGRDFPLELIVGFFQRGNQRVRGCQILDVSHVRMIRDRTLAYNGRLVTRPARTSGVAGSG